MGILMVNNEALAGNTLSWWTSSLWVLGEFWLKAKVAARPKTRTVPVTERELETSLM